MKRYKTLPLTQNTFTFNFINDPNKILDTKQFVFRAFSTKLHYQLNVQIQRRRGAVALISRRLLFTGNKTLQNIAEYRSQQFNKTLSGNPVK